ncbi:MAG: immune inhibitor A [Spirochaetales bacterium]|nr:immune inhibitor A [Spirochaetales bacterium]
MHISIQTVFYSLFIVMVLLFYGCPSSDNGDSSPESTPGPTSTPVLTSAPGPGNYIYDFNDTDPGWVTTLDWEWGTPGTIIAKPTSNPDAVNPSSSDGKCYGTDMDGIYDHDGDTNAGNNFKTYYCQVGPHDLSIFSENIELRYDIWYNVDLDMDFIQIQISTDGINYAMLPMTSPEYSATNSIPDTYTGELTTWTAVRADLNSYASETAVYIRWCLETDTNSDYDDGGLFIDNVEIGYFYIEPTSVPTATPVPTDTPVPTATPEATNIFMDFNGTDPGWTTTLDWEWGTPGIISPTPPGNTGAANPSSSDGECYGTDMDGIYDYDGDPDAGDNFKTYYLEYGPVDLSVYAGTVELRYDIWYDVDTDFDFIQIQISTDGLNYAIVYMIDEAYSASNFIPYTYTGERTTWTAVRADLAAYADETHVYFRWCLESDSDEAWNDGGLFIDNVEIGSF